MDYGWMSLTDEEEKELWSRFIKLFHPRPSKTIFPSYIPTPFIQYDISNCYTEEFIRDFENKAASAFQSCTTPGEHLYALDWQHECYLVDARKEFPRHVPWRIDNGDWIISIFPDGDYHFFLASDFSWGILGHPWEESITIYGEKILSYFLKEHPLMLKRLIRQG
ncbi:DUF2716 domain-containing protein [Paenibacillus radicis (ex Xue et al. 2023)]|uniref:DUF2716 domain-containing protein n=1 Tax=Paenibacillus radicis (ex Xue et al. 2023) TaxID=2972489 RepID=A0ABT1YQ76_9BACL|nr:DUF2716 domain-containing protein [Paenibacillus radicis (ex Xue et al. 2023)]MCR8635331.1 DUF2716 domain-containing protein [Paenibacillus radicis (ex Xue et al. 2023)]